MRPVLRRVRRVAGWLVDRYNNAHTVTQYAAGFLFFASLGVLATIIIHFPGDREPAAASDNQQRERVTTTSSTSTDHRAEQRTDGHHRNNDTTVDQTMHRQSDQMALDRVVNMMNRTAERASESNAKRRYAHALAKSLIKKMKDLSSDQRQKIRERLNKQANQFLPQQIDSESNTGSDQKSQSTMYENVIQRTNGK